jgi:hypothetical protein
MQGGWAPGTRWHGLDPVVVDSAVRAELLPKRSKRLRRLPRLDEHIQGLVVMVAVALWRAVDHDVVVPDLGQEGVLIRPRRAVAV